MLFVRPCNPFKYASCSFLEEEQRCFDSSFLEDARRRAGARLRINREEKVKSPTPLAREGGRGDCLRASGARERGCSRRARERQRSKQRKGQEA
jgi:hypothetical protein